MKSGNNSSSVKMTTIMKVAAIVCSLLMLVVLIVPIWQIQLTAPQYPEGLTLKIFANKLSGNVAVINGLNHYIGMRMLHTEDFIEFTILPYIISGYAALGFLTFFLNRKKIFNTWFILLIFIAVVSMVDFYRWEYDYGHELNPDAPIKVPGMSYQPPLIGYKQLLNFSAYSIPDIGGWIFVGVGLLLAATWFFSWKKERKSRANLKHKLSLAVVAILITTFLSCSTEPRTIRYGKDSCNFCKMLIMDGRYAAQCISTKGKSYKFDDTHCLVGFLKNGGIWRNEIAGIYFSDYSKNDSWINSADVFFLRSEYFHSPMGGNIAAFFSDEERKTMNQQFNGELLAWKDVNPLK